MRELVEVSQEERVAWLAFNRPEKRNALSPALNEAVLAALRALQFDTEVDVVVLTGNGDAFCAGMDLKEFFRDNEDDPVAAAQATWTMRQWAHYLLRSYPKPTIAAVNGWCFGGAFTPLASCDLAIAAEDAVFGLSEVNWGIIPAGSVSWDLALSLRDKEALYYILTGSSFSATRARELGLVNEVVESSKLHDAVMSLAEVLKKRNPYVLRRAKEAFRHCRTMEYEQAFDYLMAKMAEVTKNDPENGRARALTQFLDEKAFRPGLESYQR
jgi:trans-feruloyl-CoA hydratase/vanillin synthase